MNASETAQEAPQRLSRWEEVIFPSYRIQPPSRPSQRVPLWVQRMKAGELKGKDLTDG